MRGRPTVVCVCWAMLSGVLGCSGPGSPNLLLVTVDTLRADRLACYGGESDLGLAICEGGWTGTRFERAFSTASHTSPSIASLLTSRYPRDHSVTASYATKLKPELLTVADVLAEAGYSTAAIVSNPVLDQERGMDQGFDVYDDERDRPERNRPHLRVRGAKATTDAALDWLSHAPAGRVRDAAVRDAYRRWIYLDGDAAYAWAASIGRENTEPWFGAVAELYSMRISWETPVEAMAWVALIVDEDRRELSYITIARRWREKDESAADAWIAGSPLSQEARERAHMPPKRTVLPRDRKPKAGDERRGKR